MKINKKYMGGGVNKMSKNMYNKGGLSEAQKKMDKNNNNKIDSEDLAMLRKAEEGMKMKYAYGGKNEMMYEGGGKNRMMYEDGGKTTMRYLQDGGKTTMRYLQDGGKPELDEFGNEIEGKTYSSKGLKEKSKEFDPGVDRQTVEEAGNPTKNLTTKNPSGGKWLGDKRPPMYGASKEHIPFLTAVYELMDNNEDMDEMYHSQKHLRPYIKYIIAGQNETVLPSLENAEGAKDNDEKGKGKMPAFMQNMNKDDIMEMLKNMPGRK